MRLTDRIAIVTGSGQGIGRSIAETFAREGATVIIAEKSPEAGQAAEASIRDTGGSAHFFKTDVADPRSVEHLMRRVDEQFGALHVLVNNAGVSHFSPIDELTVETWDAILNVNLRGPFLCSQAAAPLMRRSGGGSIIQIASTRALMSEPGNEAYAASKGGLLALTHALANSLGPDIRVNAICPGWIHIGGDPLRPIDHAQHPAGRVGRPQDIANACLFLATDESSFMTGQRLVIDGGMTIKMIYAD
ncbi:SDR family NAD(P)-dependent oxidoreductase [Effusibacillus pohliae]|uniref:SDR family NAD(P)-dependent oxidoreductase n=1 Tax=Effusibacillus pohliae TaxID=232270 RepID=UPI000363E98F|nr:glucose 1-dehydrogenase [Effusibacillus pohliae]